MVLTYSCAEISGALLNPAVTLGCFLVGHKTLKQFAVYCGAQLLGGLIATFVAMCIVPTWNFALVAANDAVTIRSAGKGSIGAIFGAEVFYTFLLVFVVLNTTVSG